ncbi:MAG: ABC transporter ATP-binding protein [Clostridium sp.]|nr:ABC transporter ATP-binding protein [Clostridium sp.]
MKSILKNILKYKTWLGIGSLGMLIVIALDLCVPFLQKELLDKGIAEGQIGIVTPIILALLAITISKGILGYIKEYLYDLTSSHVHEDIKKDLFSHIQKLEFKYFDNMNTGELMARIGEDAEIIWDTIGYGLRLFIENAIYFIVSVVILFYLSWKLTLACLLVLIPIVFLGIKLEENFGGVYEEISDKTAEINTAAQENIAGIKLVKAFTREKYEIEKFMKLNKDYYGLCIKQAKMIGIYFPPIEFLTNISLMIMIVLGGYFVMKEEISIGVLIAFSGYMWNIIWPMRTFGELLNLISMSSASIKNISKIFNREPEIKNNESNKKPSVIKGKVEFKNVSFGYRDENVLKNINLEVPAGSTVAIMGTTGAGKSSLLSLIGRHYEVMEGEVLVDDINVKDYNLNTLRSNMSIVPQDTFLFSQSIKENLIFSNSNATDLEVEEACKVACCYDFINSLENKYDTEIGERGLGLSGGQKQRLSIGRALLRKAPILILDDATSALDMETEHALLKNLNDKNKNCTTFIIAHRISAVKNADIIIYLENGEIKEKGTHLELLERKGEYFKIYCEQFKDFNELEEEVI